MDGWRFVFAIIVAVLIISCDRGDSDDDTQVTEGADTTEIEDTESSEEDTDTSNVNIVGFDFNLKEGDYWEYEWDYYSSSAHSDGGSSSSLKGVFRITLGAPSNVGDLTAYPLLLSGNYRQDSENKDPFVSPRWTHIAMQNNKILVSSDGSTFETLFDANTGYAIGFGFFEELSSNNLFEISASAIDNDYISGDAYVLTDSASESNCEYFDGHGTICGADVEVEYTLVRREYYQATVGPVGYYYDYSTSSGGTFDSVHTSSRVNIGLVASSLRGDAVDHTLETEPNNAPESASVVNYTSLPITIKGDFSSQADRSVALTENYSINHNLYLNSWNENEPNSSLSDAETITLHSAIHGHVNSDDEGEAYSFSVSDQSINTRVEDWYHVTNDEYRDFVAELEFYGAAENVDIDLWLLDSDGALESYSVGDNQDEDGSDDRERIIKNYLVGDYYLGVDIHPSVNSNSTTEASYTLSLYFVAHRSEPSTNTQVPIRDFYRIDLENSSRLRITSTPSLGIFLTELDGETVIASAPNSFDSDTTQTLLETPLLEPGDYLISTGKQNFHTAEENRDMDKYEVTIDVIQ
jgi:hypothetical protein